MLDVMFTVRGSTSQALKNVLSSGSYHFVLLVLGYNVLRAVYLLWFHPLSDVPGPRIAAVTDLWKTYTMWRKCFATALRSQHARYGDVVRIGPNEVSVIAPDDIQTIYGFKSEFLKGPFYDAFAIVGKGHFSDRDEVTHGIQRRTVAPAYSVNHLTSLEAYCDTCTALLLPHLDRASESGSLIDLSEVVEWYTYDCVSGIGFGKNFGLLENGRDITGVLKTTSATHVIATAGTLTNYGWIFSTMPVAWLTHLTLGEWGPKFLIKLALNVVNERLELRNNNPSEYEKGKDMLYRFMNTIDTETSTPLGLRSLLANTVTIIQAGADTTRTSMVAFLRYVYAHPATVERLRGEMDAAIAAGLLEFPITHVQASRLEFLWACMKEAMRLHPAAGGMPLQRVVPAGGRVIGGRHYHAGTLIGMTAREIHYDPRAFGQDAGHWRPERWLGEDRKDLEKFNLTFGQGARGCLGKNLSLMEMSKLLPTIVYHYDVVIEDPEQPWKSHESWFQAETEFFCKISKRKQDNVPNIIRQ